MKKQIKIDLTEEQKYKLQDIFKELWGYNAMHLLTGKRKKVGAVFAQVFGTHMIVAFEPYEVGIKIQKALGMKKEDIGKICNQTEGETE